MSSPSNLLGVGENKREDRGVGVGDGDRISVSRSEVGEAGSIEEGMGVLLVLPC